jgi:hypothetical protein
MVVYLDQDSYPPPDQATNQKDDLHYNGSTKSFLTIEKIPTVWPYCILVDAILRDFKR